MKTNTFASKFGARLVGSPLRANLSQRQMRVAAAIRTQVALEYVCPVLLSAVLSVAAMRARVPAPIFAGMVGIS